MPTLSISAGPMLGAELGVQLFRRDQAPNHSLKAARPRNSSYNPGILIRVGLGVSHYPASLYGRENEAGGLSQYAQEPQTKNYSEHLKCVTSTKGQSLTRWKDSGDMG